MPESAPGSIEAKPFADVIAYVLQANGMPAGKEELPSDSKQLERITIEPAPGAAAKAPEDSR
jgi:hypothetical protein